MAADPRSGFHAGGAKNLSDDDRPVADGRRFRPELVGQRLAGIRTGGAVSDRRRGRAPACRDPPHGGRRQLHSSGSGAGCRGAENGLHDFAAGACLQAVAGRPGGGRPQGMDPGEFRRPQRRQGFCTAFRQDAARRHFGRVHLFRLPRCHSRTGRGCRRPGGARSGGLCRRLFGKFRNLGLGAVRGYSETLLRRLHRAMGQHPARYQARAIGRPECRQREPQGPFERQLRAEAPAYGGRPGDRADPVR